MPESDVPDSPFQSTLPCAGGDCTVPPCAGGDVMPVIFAISIIPFQSTPPCAGGDSSRVPTLCKRRISIHAPLCGGRHGKTALTPRDT